MQSVEEVDDQIFQEFVVFIKSGSIQKIDEMLSLYGNKITNKLESQLRQPPLYFAVNLPDDNQSSQVIKKLIHYGANPNFKDQNQQSAIFYACRDGKIKCVQLLLENGVSLLQEDTYGQTPLFYIASENQLKLLEMYTQKQHYNHIDKLAQQTPLYYAAKKGHYEMCKALIQKGTSVIHHDIHHKTAVEYARRARYHEITDYLSSEVKKVRQSLRIQQQQAKEQEKHESSLQQRKKKEKQANVIQSPKIQRNTYKLVFMDSKGQVHSVTQEQGKKLFSGKPYEPYIYNPASIPKQLLDRNNQEKWQKMAAKILNLCWKVKGGFWFHEPVEPVKFGILDYNDIITYPMDLGTVKKKLNFNAYKNPQQFAQQMRLIWKNCYRYNGEEHDISICAKQVQKIFEENYESSLKLLNEDQIVEEV